jgi:hypothetical protein
MTATCPWALARRAFFEAAVAGSRAPCKEPFFEGSCRRFEGSLREEPFFERAVAGSIEFR